jgi:hypothetical protein
MIDLISVRSIHAPMSLRFQVSMRSAMVRRVHQDLPIDITLEK